MRKKVHTIMIAAALGAGLAVTQYAGAQTAPGAERSPSGPPNAGDVRATPGADPAKAPPARASDPMPNRTAAPNDRAMQPAGPPNAGDTRATPDAKSRDARKGMDRDRTSSRSDIPERSGSGLGSAEKRPDGPDAGVPKSGVKP
jgi:hypothetical protein